MAYGRPRLPPEAPPAKMIGSTGSTHGEIAVITPARKPIPSRTTMAEPWQAGAYAFLKGPAPLESAWEPSGEALISSAENPQRKSVLSLMSKEASWNTLRCIYTANEETQR